MTDPFQQFAEWFREAEAAVPVDPNAMVLSTVGADGRPSSRVVLLKGFDDEGFVFYGNLDSRKFRAAPGPSLGGAQLPLEAAGAAGADRGPRDAGHGRRGGRVLRHPAARKPDRRLGLEAERAARQPRDARGRGARGRDTVRRPRVPRPPHWSGFRLEPDRIEFWEAGEFRLHDRHVFRRASAADAWTDERLYP